MKSLIKSTISNIVSLFQSLITKSGGVFVSVNTQQSSFRMRTSAPIAKKTIAFFIVTAQLTTPFITYYAYASEVGHKPNTSAINVIDAYSKISLDKAIESNQASTAKGASAGTIKSTAPAIKSSTNVAPTVVTAQDNSAVKGNKITLASKGDADEGSGAFQYSIPIITTAGRNGLNPNMSLSYDSRRNNQTSYIGLGWELEIPTISRMNKNGADVMFDENNFNASMTGELAKTDTILGASPFGAYTVKYSFGDYTFNENNTWVYMDKNGVKYVYGINARDRIDNGDPDKTSLWSLSYTEDTLGNKVEYSYVRSEGKLYPQTISWNDGTSRLDFTYELYNFKVDGPAEYDAAGNKLP